MRASHLYYVPMMRLVTGLANLRSGAHFDLNRGWLLFAYIEPINILLTRGRGARMARTQLFVAPFGIS